MYNVSDANTQINVNVTLLPPSIALLVPQMRYCIGKQPSMRAMVYNANSGNTFHNIFHITPTNPFVALTGLYPGDSYNYTLLDSNTTFHYTSGSFTMPAAVRDSVKG